MSLLPNTTTPKSKRSAGIRITVLVLAVLLAAVLFTLFSDDDFAPGEEILAPGVEDIAAGSGDASFPVQDTSRFDGTTEMVRVYLRVEDLPPGRRMIATVERSGRSSAVSRFFGRGVRVEGGGEERVSVSGNGVSGVVVFAVRARSALPAGEYTVGVYSVGGEGVGEESILARKYFLVGDP